MNKAEVIETIQNIFHSTYVDGKGISMADWGIPIFLNVEFYDDGINIDDISFVSRFDDDKMAQQAYRVISQVMSNSLRYITCEGHNSILAFPLNCNLIYCKNLRDAFEMNEGEDKWDYYSRKHGKQSVTNSSHKLIKSSLDDRLVPYLEEFEEGLADAQVVAPGDEMDIPSREETFFEIFKSDYNLTDDDIKALKDSVYSIWEASAGA